MYNRLRPSIKLRLEAELRRNFVTTKLSEVAAHLGRQRFVAVTSFVGMSKSEWEIKWISDTYYGLRKIDDSWAALFGHPSHDSASIQDRADRLRTILEIS